MSTPFPMIEKAVKELIVALMADVEDTNVGGDLSYDATTDDFYIWLGLVGGAGDDLGGEWIVDIDVFDTHYAQAMQRCLDLEALLLKRGGHRTSLMRFDRVYQNETPLERPWDDESAFRVGATYVFTARRSG